MTRSAIALLVFAAALAIAAPAAAQIYLPQSGGAGAVENIEGFTVMGKGLVTARPNLVEIDMDVSAASELTADAIVKYRDARRRLRDAFTALKLSNLTIDERGLLVDQKGMPNPYYMGGMPMNTRAKTEVQLTRRLVVKAANIRKMDEEALLQLVAKLLDVGQDAGARIGSVTEFNPYYYNPYMRNSTGLVRFVLDDLDELQEQAYEKAVADARSRAQRLARLSGVELGQIVAIRELAVPGERPANSDDDTGHKRLEMTKFQEMPVRVELLVRFETHSRTEPKGRTGER